MRIGEFARPTARRSRRRPLHSGVRYPGRRADELTTSTTRNSSPRTRTMSALRRRRPLVSARPQLGLASPCGRGRERCYGGGGAGGTAQPHRAIALQYLTFEQLVLDSDAELLDRGVRGTNLHRLALPPAWPATGSRGTAATTTSSTCATPAIPNVNSSSGSIPTLASSATPSCVRPTRSA